MMHVKELKKKKIDENAEGRGEGETNVLGEVGKRGKTLASVRERAGHVLPGMKDKDRKTKEGGGEE